MSSLEAITVLQPGVDRIYSILQHSLCNVDFDLTSRQDLQLYKKYSTDVTMHKQPSDSTLAPINKRATLKATLSFPAN